MGECVIDSCTVYGLAKPFVSLQAKDGFQGCPMSPNNECALVSLPNSVIIWCRHDFGKDSDEYQNIIIGSVMLLMVEGLRGSHFCHIYFILKEVFLEETWKTRRNQP